MADGVLDIGDGYRAKNAEFVENGGLPFVRVGDVSSAIRLDGLDELPVDSAGKYGSKVSQSYDSLITMKGTVGRVAYVTPTTRSFVYSPQISYWRSLDHDQLHPRWLRYWLESSEFVSQALATKGATDMADYINLRDQRRMNIALPPPVLQHRVADVLGTLDDLMENNRRRIELLEQMAQAIYREWFVNFRYPGHEQVPLVSSGLGPVPKGWTVQTLGQSCSVMQAGGTPSRRNADYWTDGTVDWFKTAELQDGFLLSSTERVTEDAVKERKTRLFQSGTILMAIYGSPTVGRLGVLTTPATCNQAALAMVGSTIPQVVLYYTLVELRAHFNSIAQGAAQQNISKQKVEETPIVCPPPAVCGAVEEVTVPFWEQRRILELATARLRSTRDLLLPRLVTGQIDVSAFDLDAFLDAVA